MAEKNAEKNAEKGLEMGPEEKHGQPDLLGSTLARVRRRELASRVLHMASFDLLLVLSAYTGYLVLKWALGLPDHALVVFLYSLGGWFLVTSIRAAVSLRLSLFGTAVLVDDRLHLKERVSSAVYLDRRPDSSREGAWAELVRRDGVQSLAGVDVARSFPVRLPRVARWILIPLALAALLLCLPPLDFLGWTQNRQVEAKMKSVVADKRAELPKKIEDLLKKSETPLLPDLEKALEELARKEGENFDPKKNEAVPEPSADEAKKKTLVKFARLEEMLQKQMSRTEFDQLKAFLDRFPPGSKGSSALTKALREAMKSGNFQKALSEAKSLQDQLKKLAKKQKDGNLSPEEADKLRKLAEELARLSRDSALMSNLSRAFSGASSALTAGNFSQALSSLQSLEMDFKSLAQMNRDLQFLQDALDMAQLSMSELANLHKCPNCGKVSQQPGGT